MEGRRKAGEVEVQAGRSRGTFEEGWAVRVGVLQEGQRHVQGKNIQPGGREEGTVRLQLGAEAERGYLVGGNHVRAGLLDDAEPQVVLPGRAEVLAVRVAELGLGREVGGWAGRRVAALRGRRRRK